MLILLPPSEGKAPGGTGAPWADAPRALRELDGARREVIAALRVAMRAEVDARSKLLGVGDAAATTATAANLVVDSAPTMAAIERYTGVLYDALGYASLQPAARRRVDEQVLILSGLWGAVAPRDPIPDYKLKMGATLPPLGRLSSWWRPRLAPAIDARAEGRVVWNLLPGEHAAAWRPAGGAAAQVSVRFLDEVTRNGARHLLAVGHWNKALKGELVRWLVTARPGSVDDLAGFCPAAGYRYRPDLTATEGVRTDVAFVAER
jgi:uncharacterized protein